MLSSHPFLEIPNSLVLSGFITTTIIIVIIIIRPVTRDNINNNNNNTCGKRHSYQ